MIEDASPLPLHESDGTTPAPVVAAQVRAELARAAPAWQPEFPDAIGFTMFDSPSSEDGTVTVLLPQEAIERAPSQALVRIRSRDGRSYLGAVVAGPFAEPDGMRADSPLLIMTVTQGGIFTPPHHGRVQVELLGEEQDGVLVPPRLRPLPQSPVWTLSAAESARVLRLGGEIQLGTVVGQEQLTVGVPALRKDVLPRHLAILGTTGGGKSTTVARLVAEAQRAGFAVILLDVEGEYTFLHEPTADPRMCRALAQRGLAPTGVPNVTLYHLVNRDTANPDHPQRCAFALQFARLSPYATVELLELTEPQSQRFFQAYDLGKQLLREFGIFPAPNDPRQEQLALEVDEFERGYPRLELLFFTDLVGACLAVANKLDESWRPRHPRLKPENARKRVLELVQALKPSHPNSWGALLGRLNLLHRLKAFDQPDGAPMSYKRLLRAGHVSVIDLSDTGSPVLSNLVIADVLHGVQEAREEEYTAFERQRRQDGPTGAPPPVLIIIEEAHEFLSRERAAQMEVLFQQVTRIARRGRKRWLGLVFVTQLPQHLPPQLFGLVNSYILHKITDPRVADDLRRTVSGIDPALWQRLPTLAPGQAIVAFPHLARPLLAAIDPTPAQLRLID
ncbi:MAG: ATP-binding protein [Chloroflexi bacterium]|nr:ATP-binding protein [Chloroflexota bacterium]